MTHRESILRALVRYDRPPEEVLAELGGLDPESGEMVEGEEEQQDEGEEQDEGRQVEIGLTPDDAIAVLTRFVEGDITSDELDRWSTVVRDHDFIVLDSDHRELLEPLLDELSELTPATAGDWVARLDLDV